MTEEQGWLVIVLLALHFAWNIAAAIVNRVADAEDKKTKP